MKIIQVIPMFGLAGAETMCENLTLALINQGHDVKVVSLYDYHSAITDRLEKNNVSVSYLGKKKGWDNTIIPKLIRLFRNEKPDIVHSHLYAIKYAMVAAIAAGVKGRIHTIHNIANKETTKLGQRLNYIFFNYANVIPVSLSAEIQRTVAECYKLTEGQTPIVYNGIDLNKCQQKKNYEKTGNLKFIHVGRFSVQKNHELLIRAFYRAHIQNKATELILIGAGELQEEVKKLIEDLGLEQVVHCIGLTADIYSWLNRADVLVMSSRYEGMPMTIIEAMGTGLPIISTNVGGIASMVENGKEGILTGVDEDQLSGAMIKMQDKRYREYLGKNARVKAENVFSSATMAQKYLDIYRKGIAK